MKKKLIIYIDFVFIIVMALLISMCTVTNTTDPEVPGLNGKNNPPKLISGTVAPKEGSPLTEFIYEVKYYDEDGDPPLTIYVFIDGARYTMGLYDGSYDNGIYRYSRSLTPGVHNFSFSCSDMNGSTSIIGTIYGPNVI